MAGNANLHAANKAKNDEFYTQYADIQKEVNAYIEYNPDVFRGKTILLPCDDPEWSNFTKFFAQNFEFFGLKKLISTSYAIESKKYKTDWQPTLFETENPLYNVEKSRIKGKIFTLTHDTNNSGRIDIDDLQWSYLEGDGDFRSAEVTALRDEADIIITNPPFSLFREFMAWVMEGKKQFAVIGNKNSITYKEIFPLIKENKLWIGYTSTSLDILFTVPKEMEKDLITQNQGSAYKIIDGHIFARSASIWFTNIEHGRRHEPLRLMSMADNLEFNKKMKGQKEYYRYDNYDALEVPFTELIPKDYSGIMGVPISFLDKYCPEQFEILGMCENEDLYNLKTKVYSTAECKQAYVDKFGKSGTYDLNASGVIIKDGLREKVYQRILIRHKNSQL
ncbi:MAG: DNA methyltransferase [Paludibacteraceae bacterium]|nr:DNA methyltransferase [Paludibacteraceae bacterium]